MSVDWNEPRGLRHRLVRRNAGVLAPGDATILFGGGFLIFLAIGGFWAFATGVSPDAWVPVLLLVIFATISVPMCLVASNQPRDKKLRAILLLGLVLKLLCVFPRYAVNEGLYKGEADAGQYHNAGQVFYQNFHDGNGFSLKGARIENLPTETRTVGFITGILFLVTGTTYFGGYITFAWLCWIGLLCFFKAFRVAYPNAPPHLAAVLIFFLPSMLYWPSSIGKDAIMVLCIGVMTLGIARILTPSKPLRGLVLLVPSAGVMIQVRPHLMLIAVVGVAASMVARSSTEVRTAAAATSRILLLVAFVPILIFGLSRVDHLFGSSSDGNNFTVSGALERTSDQTSIGGSAFETQPVKSPLDLPVATVSVLYRPFPFEVNSLPVLISSLEGTALLLGTLVAGRWIWRVGPAMRRHPFAAYCGAYVLAFVFAFSNVGNAGILARQRVQMFPVLMLLVAAAREHHRIHVELPALLDPAEEVEAVIETGSRQPRLSTTQ
ncbi:hypothetical protein BH10ACT1_BH10ACT1_07950 [soil metagenome]